MTATLRLVIISDTHGHRDFPVPAGDVLIHAGDGCRSGSLDEAAAWGEQLASYAHPHKLVIAGNHDRCFESDPDAARRCLPPEIHYLQDSGCEIEGIRFWGSPWQPWFLSWAFNLQRGPELAAKWALIPDDTDVLVTHGPPQGILDRTFDDRAVGCEALTEALRRVRPRVHCFGHIHEGYGTLARDGTLHVNASTCTLSYQPTNPAVVIELPREPGVPARAL